MRFRTLSWAPVPPAAGQGLSIVFTTVERVKLESLLFTFTASATAGNRQVFAQLQDPNGLAVFETGAPAAITASEASDFVLSTVFGNVVSMQGPVNAAVGLPFPNFWLPPGWKVALGAVGISAADQFSALSYVAHYGEDVWDQENRLVEIAELVSSLSA